MIWVFFRRKVKLLPSENAAKAKQEAIHYAKNFKVDFIFFLSSHAHLERSDVLNSLVKKDVQVIAPFLKTYEKFSFAYRICQLGRYKQFNDSSSFPNLVAQKDLKLEHYQNILVSKQSPSLHT